MGTAGDQGGTRDFDSAAATWDEKPARVNLAADIAETIRKKIDLRSNMDAFDFGCGTGLLTLQLQPYVRSITGMDNSQKMLDVLQSKIERFRLSNVGVRPVAIEKGNPLEGSYHLAVSAMTFHHIRNVAPLLKQFHEALLPGGAIAIADLDLDGGRFHDDNQGVFHFGFHREEFRRTMEAGGFIDVRHTTAAEIVKPTPDGEPRRFTVFLMSGRKP